MYIRDIFTPKGPAPLLQEMNEGEEKEFINHVILLLLLLNQKVVGECKKKKRREERRESALVAASSRWLVVSNFISEIHSQPVMNNLTTTHRQC